jgi:hypothetical protein
MEPTAANACSRLVPQRKELETYRKFPALQTPASYNLDQVIEAIKAAKHISHAGH